MTNTQKHTGILILAIILAVMLLVIAGLFGWRAWRGSVAVQTQTHMLEALAPQIPSAHDSSRINVFDVRSAEQIDVEGRSFVGELEIPSSGRVFAVQAPGDTSTESTLSTLRTTNTGVYALRALSGDVDAQSTADGQSVEHAQSIEHAQSYADSDSTSKHLDTPHSLFVIAGPHVPGMFDTLMDISDGELVMFTDAKGERSTFFVVAAENAWIRNEQQIFAHPDQWDLTLVSPSLSGIQYDILRLARA